MALIEYNFEEKCFVGCVEHFGTFDDRQGNPLYLPLFTVDVNGEEKYGGTKSGCDDYISSWYLERGDIIDVHPMTATEAKLRKKILDEDGI